MENSRSAYGVNSHGDMCIVDRLRAYLYTDEDGLWALDDMVFGETADVEHWADSSHKLCQKDQRSRRNRIRVDLRRCNRSHSTSPGRRRARSTAFVLTPVLP